jgi:hypothetical protein
MSSVVSWTVIDLSFVNSTHRVALVLRSPELDDVVSVNEHRLGRVVQA